MMKKVLYGVALTLFAGVSVGSLQSCKDDLNDLATQTSFNLSTLQSQIEVLKAEIDTKANAADLVLYAKLETVNDLLRQVNDLSTRLTALENKPSGSDYDDTELRNLYENLNTLYNQLNGAVTTLQGDIANKVDATELRTQLDALKTAIEQDLDTKLSNQKTDLEASQAALKQELEGKIKVNEAAITALDTYLKENYYTKDEVYNKDELLNKDEVLSEFEQVYLQLEEAKEMISQVLNVLQDQITEVDEKVDDLIEAVNNIVKSIVNQLDNKISGILIQGVKSPVFGEFSLPIGIKSNILFNWYGLNDNNSKVDFPSNMIAFSATGEPGLDLSKLNPTGKITIEEGDYFEDVLLGNVYVTVNPAGTNYNDRVLTIENTAGAKLPLQVVLKESDEVLYHGYTRTVDNGFYKGEVKLEATDENINAVRIKLEDGLKSTMKDALKNPSKRTAAALVKALYDQMSGMLPAYALRYDWTVGSVPTLDEDNVDPAFSQKANAVLSQYDLAVATARPLSFKFLEDFGGVNKKLPIIKPIENYIDKILDEGDFSLDLKSIKIEKAEIKIGKITITAKVDIDGKAIKIIIPQIEILDENGHPTGTKTKETEIILGADKELKDVYGAIEEGLTKAINQIQTDVNNWTGTMQKDINDQLNKILKDVEGQVNSMIESINGQIDDMIDNVLDNFHPVFSKIDRAFDIYNKIAKKVNNILKDPNAYLQATALYSMNGGYGFVSGDSKHPTTFKQAGGNAFALYLTSYTGELVVPAYKKYVAVTGVNGTDSRSLAEINAAAGNSFNTVLDGSDIRVLAKGDAFKSGNIYEFTYQALDYHGCTSTRKFYIQVK